MMYTYVEVFCYAQGQVSLCASFCESESSKSNKKPVLNFYLLVCYRFYEILTGTVHQLIFLEVSSIHY